MAVLEGLRISTENGADFDTELDDEFAPDPAPQERPRKSRKEPVVRTAPRRARSTPTLAKQVGDELGGVFEMVAAGWAMVGDECCSPVLEQQAKPIGVALANILKRYPSLLSKLADSDVLSMGLSAAMLVAAVKPVAVAVYHNHIAKEGTDDAADPAYLAGIEEHFRLSSPTVR